MSGRYTRIATLLRSRLEIGSMDPLAPENCIWRSLSIWKPSGPAVSRKYIHKCVSTVDLSGVVDDIDGTTISPNGLACLRAVDLESLPVATGIERLGPCVARPGKFICIGLNYADHASETGADVPREPVVFLKATSAVSGPNDCIIKPRGSTKLDWEVELAIVIGSECRYVDEKSAQSAIAGYCVCNDVSERAFQLERGGQWDKGKGCDSFGPIGPWLVTRTNLLTQTTSTSG